MLKLFFTRRVAAGWLMCLATALALAACGGAAAPTEPAETEAAADTQAESAPATDEAVAETTEAVDETATTEAIEEPASSAQAVVASPPAVCEPIDIPDNELIPAPTEDDWALGPETAAITVIEYGDFQ